MGELTALLGWIVLVTSVLALLIYIAAKVVEGCNPPILEIEGTGLHYLERSRGLPVRYYYPTPRFDVATRGAPRPRPPSMRKRVAGAAAKPQWRVRPERARRTGHLGHPTRLARVTCPLPQLGTYVSVLQFRQHLFCSGT
jgi:hypothetical protein